MNRLKSSALVALAVSGTAVIAFACSGTSTSGEFQTGGNGGSTTGNPTSTSTGDGGLFSTVGSGGNMASALVVTPVNPTLKVDVPLPMQPPTVQFKCLDAITMKPVGGAIWTLDTPATGLIDSGGLFTATGAAGGHVKVSCSQGNNNGSTTLTVLVHNVENMGGLSPGDIGTL